MKRKIRFKPEFILLALLGLVVIVGFIWFLNYQETIFSGGVLRLEILGPDSAKVGEEVEYTVKYKNNGNFTLENPILIFELPDNSLTEDSKIRFTQNLKDIYPGAEELVKFKGRLIGKENDLKTAKAQFSYKPHNLSSRYNSKTTFTTKIATAPITLTLDLTSSTERGKQLTYSINYFSNVDYPLDNLSIRTEDLNGFAVASSSPSSLSNNAWKLGTVSKGQGGRIKITGTVLSGASDVLSFKVKLGRWQDGIFTSIKEVQQDVQVASPKLSVSQQVNDSDNYAASPGELLNYRIIFRNSSSSTFNDLSTAIKLQGQAFNIASLKSDDGQVQQNGIITFDSQKITQLQHLDPQQEASVSFSVKLNADLDGLGLERNNATVKDTVSVFDLTEDFSLKINSTLDLRQKAYYSKTDGIENSGPVPPRVDQPTSYVIHWQVKNIFNDAKNVKVRASLPEYVTLNDAMFPEDQAAHFSFDSASREIVWLAGNLSAGSSTSLSFQIVLKPVALQKGSLVQLIGQAKVSAEDQFTGSIIESSALAIASNLPDDQSNSGGGIVR